jgi:hypothetical protein
MGGFRNAETSKIVAKTKFFRDLKKILAISPGVWYYIEAVQR